MPPRKALGMKTATSTMAIEMTAVSNATGLSAPSDGLLFPPCGVDDLAHTLRPKSEGGVLEGKAKVEVGAAKGKQLLAACKGGRQQEALSLVEQGADVNYANSIDLSTPLQFASANRKLSALVPRLIELGAELDAVDERGFSALLWTMAGIAALKAAIVLLLPDESSTARSD